MLAYETTHRNLAAEVLDAEVRLREAEDLLAAISIRASVQTADICFVDAARGTRLSYEQLDEESTRVAHDLTAAGLPTGTVVALPLDVSLVDHVVAWVAAVKAALRPVAVSRLSRVTNRTGIELRLSCVAGPTYPLAVVQTEDTGPYDGGDAVIEPRTGQISPRSAADLRALAAATPKILPMLPDVVYRVDEGTFTTILAWHLWRGRRGYAVDGGVRELCGVVERFTSSAVILTREHYEQIVRSPEIDADLSSVHEINLTFVPRVTVDHQNAARKHFPRAAVVPQPALDSRLRLLVTRSRNAVSGRSDRRARVDLVRPVAEPTPSLREVLPEAAASYVELLIGVLTRSIFEHEYTPATCDGHFRRTGINHQARVLGRDWPSEAETMVGWHRITHLASCVANVVADGVPGDLLEAGAWRGGSSILMRGVLKVLGETGRTVWAADSFEGFPEADYTLSEHSPDVDVTSFQFPLISVDVETVRANFAKYNLYDDQVQLVRGWFHETLPSLPVRSLALLRVDGDMFDSTWAPLDAMYPRLEVGGYCIVDDYGDVRECQEAVDTYRAKHGITEPLRWIDTDAVYWRKAPDR